MKHNLRYRKPLRLRNYDYSQTGAYFVTICTKDRICLLSDIIDGKPVLSEYGIIVQNTWNELCKHYPNIDVDVFVVMPNYIHGIIIITDKSLSVGAGFKPAPTTMGHGLPEIIRPFKTFSARRINERRHTPGQPFWQRNYYEHIIRNERRLYKIREYIQNNPIKWDLDRENPKSKNFNVDHDIYWGEMYGR